MEITLSIDNTDLAIWNELLNNTISDIHDIYQTGEWASIMKECYNVVPHYIIIRENEKICGGQLYFKKRICGVFNALEASGGPLILAGYDHNHVESMILDHIRSTNYNPVYILLRPNIFSDSENNYTLRRFDKNYFYTILLYLNRSEECLWKSIHKHARNGVRKAEKSGIKVVAEDGWELWARFYKLHRGHCKEKGIAHKDIKFFSLIFKYFRPKKMAKLFVAFQNDVPVAGMIFLNFKGITTYYIGASNSEYRQYSPNDLLMWTAILWAKVSGYSIIDLGDSWPNPNSHLYNIHRFKNKWGGQLINSDFFIRGRVYAFGRIQVLNNPRIQRLYEFVHQKGFI